jgi:hypothetical protein
MAIEPCLNWRLELITTITRVTRIPLLALFFVSVMEFILENAGISLMLMAAALAILLLGRMWKIRNPIDDVAAPGRNKRPNHLWILWSKTWVRFGSDCSRKPG